MADDQVEMQEELNKLLQETVRLSQNYKQALQSQYDIMKDMMSMGLTETLESQQESIDGLSSAMRNLAKEGGGASGELTDQADALAKVSTAGAKANNILGKLASTGLKLTPLTFGFQTLIKNVTFLGSSLMSVNKIAGGAIASLARVSLSIVTLPFDAIQTFFNMAHESGGDSGLRQLLEDIRKEFGDLKTNASRDIIDMGRSMKGALAETGLSVYRVMGNLKERIEFVFQSAKAMGNTFDLVRGQLINSAEAFAAYVKGLGLSEEAQKGLATQSILSGKRITELGREITTFAYGMGEAFGINGKQISRDVGEMMKDFTNFGNLSIQTLTNVSVYARRLGVEVKNLVGVIGKFDNFEDAAKGAAHLAQAFGLNIDAFEMVKAQDPAERIELLRKSFFAAGRSIESMTRQERALLAQQTGLEDQTLALVFAQKNQGVSYADIQKKSDETKKKQLTQAEAMEKLSNSIERMVKSGSQLEGGLFSVLLQGFERGIIRSGPFRKMLMDMRRMFREIYQVGREMGRAFVDAFPGVKDVLGALSDVFSRRGIGTAFKGLKDDFKNFLDGLNPNNAASKFAEFIRAVRQRFLGFFAGPGSEAGVKLTNGLKSILKTFVGIFSGGLRLVIPAISGFIEQIVGFIAHPQDILSRAATGAQASGSFFVQEVFIPIYDAISASWPRLWEAVKSLFNIAWQKVSGWIAGFAREHWVGISAVLFGPSAISAILGAGLSMFAKAGGQLAGKGIASLFGNVNDEVGKLGRLQGARGAGEALGSSPEMLKQANQVAEVASTSTVASAGVGPKLALLAANLAAVGLVVMGIIQLAKYIKRENLSAADVGIATLTFGAAALIVGAITLMSVALAAATPVAGAGPVLLAVAVGVAALGAGVIVGMLKLIDVLRASHITVADVGLATAAMLGASAIVVAVTAAGYAMLASSALIASAPLVLAGALAIMGIASGMKDMMEVIIQTFRPIDLGAIGSTAAKAGATGAIMAGLALFATALTVASAPILIAWAAFDGLKMAVTGIADGMAQTITQVIRSFNGMPAGDEVKARVQIAVSIMGGLASFGTSIADILDEFSVFESVGNQVKSVNSLIRTMTGALRDTVRDFIRMATSEIPNPSVVQGSVEVLTNILKSVASITTAFASLKGASAGVISNIQGLAQIVLGKVKTTLTEVIPHLSGVISLITKSSVTNGNADAIKAFGSLLSSILESVGNLSRSMIVLLTREGTFFKDSQELATIAPTLGRAVSTLMDAVFSRESGFVGSIRDLIQVISESLTDLTPAQVKSLDVFRSIIVPFFEAVSKIGGVITALSGLSGSQEEIQTKLGLIKDIVFGVTTGLSQGFSSLVANLVGVMESLPQKSIKNMRKAIPIFSRLFRTIKDIVVAVSSEEVSSLKGKDVLQNLFDFIAGTEGFSVIYFSQKMQEKMPEVIASLQSLSNPISNLRTNFEHLRDGLLPVAQAISQDFINVFDTGLKTNVTHIESTIEEFSQKIAEIHGKINEVGRSININTALRNLGESIGTASPERLQIARGDLTINIQVNVKLNVDEIEEAIATRNEGSTFVVTKKGGARHQGAAPVSNI